MRKLTFATVSTLALSLATMGAGMGIGYAQVSGDSAAPLSSTAPAPPTSNPATNPPAIPQNQVQQTEGRQTQGPQADQTTPGAASTSASPSTQADQATSAAPGAQTGAQAEMTPNSPSPGQLRQAQTQLRAAGLYKGRIDGQMGPETRQAVLAFQQHHGLTATGLLDHRTMVELQRQRG